MITIILEFNSQNFELLDQRFWRRKKNIFANSKLVEAGVFRNFAKMGIFPQPYLPPPLQPTSPPPLPFLNNNTSLGLGAGGGRGEGWEGTDSLSQGLPSNGQRIDNKSTASVINIPFAR